MKETPSYAIGVITKTYHTAKAGERIGYNFIVNDKIYQGHSRKYIQDLFNIGDSCLVIYAKDDISVNDLYRDKLGRLSHINQIDSLKEELYMYMIEQEEKYSKGVQALQGCD